MTTCRKLSDNLRQVVGGIIGKYPPSLQGTSVSAVSILTKLIIIETAFSFNPFLFFILRNINNLRGGQFEI